MTKHTTAYVARHRAVRSPQLDGRRLRTVAAPFLGLLLTSALIGAAPAATAQGGGAGGAGGGRDTARDTGREAPFASRLLRAAASESGTPYRYGGTTPAGFDCSGFTRWAFAQVGRTLPRTSAAQAGAVRRVSAADARPGDLVFFGSGGSVYHVGIYAGTDAGRRMLWHSPRPGDDVSRDPIWTTSVFYGRFGG